jgi:hypothetical protein
MTCPHTKALESILFHAKERDRYIPMTGTIRACEEALAKPCGCEDSQLRDAVWHVVNDSPGTPNTVKQYLREALLRERSADA